MTAGSYHPGIEQDATTGRWVIVNAHDSELLWSQTSWRERERGVRGYGSEADAREAAEVLAALRPLEHELLPRAVTLFADGALAADPSNPRRTLLGRTPPPTRASSRAGEPIRSGEG